MQNLKKKTDYYPKLVETLLKVILLVKKIQIGKKSHLEQANLVSLILYSFSNQINFKFM